ncbi:aldehyde dehydrogenase [Roseovarius sp.]|uniref:aldehyde dehydrogenase family protein n=1 Tax=Roseovarius sp. TaxID=1486281 RepID=UPI0035165ECF
MTVTVPPRLAPDPKPSDAEACVSQAAEAMPGWARTAPLDRAARLNQLARLLSDNCETLAKVMVEEVGKTITEARAEVAASVRMADVFAAWPYWGRSARIAELSGFGVGHVLVKPRGIAALITPWNYPISNPVQKIAAALITGNAIVWRPSPATPRCSAALADILGQLDLPDGLVTTLIETGSEGAKALVADTRVAAVSFTGSSTVGTEIYRNATRSGTIVQCEMGGKNAAVVLADADIDAAASRIVAGAFGFAGQKCTAMSRVFVESAVAPQFHQALAHAVAGAVYGDPSEPSTQIGPVISSAKARALEAVVAEASTRGLKPLDCAPRTIGDVSKDTFFVPRIFTDVPRADPLMQAEFFGPILAVATITDLDDAIVAVNDSDYGLAAAIFTADRAKAMHFAAEAEVGTVKINEATPGLSVALPATGWKASGAGPGELAEESIRFFTKSTAVIG